MHFCGHREGTYQRAGVEFSLLVIGVLTTRMQTNRVPGPGTTEAIRMTDQRIRVFSILVTGIGAGILVGGLFAPRSGDASRKLIARRAQKTKKVVRNAVQDGTRFLTRGSEVRELVGRGRGMYRAAGKLLYAAL